MVGGLIQTTTQDLLEKSHSAVDTQLKSLKCLYVRYPRGLCMTLSSSSPLSTLSIYVCACALLTCECKWPASFSLLYLRSNSYANTGPFTYKPSPPNHTRSPLNTTGASPIAPYPLTGQVLSSSPLPRSHSTLTL